MCFSMAYFHFCCTCVRICVRILSHFRTSHFLCVNIYTYECSHTITFYLCTWCINTIHLLSFFLLPLPVHLWLILSSFIFPILVINLGLVTTCYTVYFFSLVIALFFFEGSKFVMCISMYVRVCVCGCVSVSHSIKRKELSLKN